MSETAEEYGPFPPSPEFSQQAVGQKSLYEEADADREAFWAKQARERLTWTKDFDKVLDWSEAPVAKWFVGGELNVAYNCADRHVEAGNGDRVALHFVGEPGDERDITYAELTELVQKAAGALKAPVSAPCTPSSSAASPPTPCARASPTGRPRSSSRPTVATAAASRALSSPPSTRPSAARRRCRRSSSSSAPAKRRR